MASTASSATKPDPKPTNPYAAAYANFLEQTKNHQLTVIQDQGLYRHLRMHDPEQGSIWSWNIVTWPGFLATAGDIADGFMFSRVEDMIAFFNVSHRDYYSDGAPSIDFGYWAQKLRGGRSIEVRKYSAKAFLDTVRDHLEEDDALGLEAQAEYDKIVAVAKRVIARHGVSWADYLRDLHVNYGGRYRDLEVDHRDSEENEYFGLGLPERSPTVRREEILNSARFHSESEHEAREWLSEHARLFGQDTWEWELWDYDIHFLFACWAIDKTVQAYLAFRREAALALTEACPTCGVWECLTCGHKRSYASRFSDLNQHCSHHSCRSTSGRMLPMIHQGYKREGHKSAYQEIIAAGHVPRYPLNAIAEKEGPADETSD